MMRKRLIPALALAAIGALALLPSAAPARAAAASGGPCVVAGVHVLGPRGGGAIVATTPNSGVYAGCPSDVRGGGGARVELGVLGPCVLVGVTENGRSVSTDGDTGVYLECPTDEPPSGE